MRKLLLCLMLAFLPAMLMAQSAGEYVVRKPKPKPAPVAPKPKPTPKPKRKTSSKAKSTTKPMSQKKENEKVAKNYW